MITDKLIGAIKSAKGTPKLGWDDSFLEKGGYLSPVSFASKKAYRGINIILLKKGNPFGAYQNPYFLTFKQVQEAKGKLKKGAKGLEVIYFTRLYKFSDAQ
ncbi:ArdC family protein, partial [Tenacibaculum sp. L6]|uniref:ArdC family protein n=1 Tax=Tenacibaculum sp. L6 TaxID=2992764 RepID=UPI00237BC6EC